MDWTRNAAFFYQLLKPGRYLGGEIGLPTGAVPLAAREVVWLYPDRYERAIADPAWRRSFFQISRSSGVRISRAIEYAGDVWQALASSHRTVFTLDHLADIRAASTVVFWAPDVPTAAHIPSIMRRAGLEGAGPKYGVICEGRWTPRFLAGHVDWIAMAPQGWLSNGLAEFLRDGGPIPSDVLEAGRRADLDEQARSWKQGTLLPSLGANTPRWVPLVEADSDLIDVDLVHVDQQGVLRMRDLSAVVLDALEGLSTTGVDGLRICNGTNGSSDLLVAAFGELQRRFNMKRVRVQMPPVAPEQFLQNWLAYRPHLLKPLLRVQLDSLLEPDMAIDVGHRALNSGWQGLNAVLTFDSLEGFEQMLAPVRQVLEGWSKAAQGYADKRPLRLEYRPAPIGEWKDAPDGPDDDTARRYSLAFRQFKDSLGGIAATGLFRIEEVMARNWLAATDIDLWDRLAELDLSDTNDPDEQPHDWFTWVRQQMSAPPKTGYVVVPAPELEIQPAMTGSALSEPAAALGAPSENLFGRRRAKPTPSRRLAAPSLMRMRVKWAKEMPWRLYSHLDLVRAIERAIRKAGLPGSYSEGFHPRLKLSFGPPLAFGLLSDGEFFDLLLDEDFQPAHGRRLSESMPKGLPLVESRGMAAGMPALSDVLNEAVYSAIIPLELAEAQAKLAEFQARTDVSWLRIGREDRRPVDPRKTLRDVKVEAVTDGTRWELTVSLGEEGNIRPTEWAMLIFGFTPERLGDIVIKRASLHVRRGSTIRSPFEIG